ncbi:DNA polymerase Pol2 [Methanosalsum zhilinae DSM 4017]|uniref:DNA polymerase n=1 Tax=Methanosalsum zhilinae (strain DSM 4017 / NBRC 107636 / OCM 62 / WeN5) TaxID=679901 RepID=F7XNK6_METZD|nr:DNA polymerase elongation subunit [Methanosalsum zhilinae]AEH60103.1 DNA polymerase Pol2 [Methanosalsum zhilinae DSM 4017]
MNFQLLDADYIRKDNSPIIRLFGRGDDGRSICCLVPGFEPYFYARPSTVNSHDELIRALEQNFNSIKRVELVEKFEPVGYQKSRKKMLKIVTYDPQNVPEIRDDVVSFPGIEEVYETDILFRNRYLVDQGIHGMKWVHADTSSDIDHSMDCDELVTSTRIEEVDRIDSAPLRHFAFDIECLPINGGMPVPEQSPVIMISLSFEPEFRGMKSIVLLGRSLDDAGDGVEVLGDEPALLNRFFEIFREYDPDVVTGYNINDFDIPYIVDRIKTLQSSGITINSACGRDGRPLDYRKIGIRSMVSITGRIVADSLPIIRQQFSLKRYNLQTVSRELLDMEKLDVSPQQMEEYWLDSGEKIRKFIDYARRDSELAMELLLKLRLLDKFVALAQISGSLPQEILEGGQTSMVENLLLREFRKHDYVLPPRPDENIVSSRNRESEGLKGGEVLEPKKGLLEKVVILDYKSLYPTIMMAHNLCYTTVIDIERPDGNIIKPPSGGEFVSAEVFRGIVPSILENLLNRRTETKGLMKGAKTEDEYRVYDATQLALKILLNSFYGYSGYTRARLYSLALANAVTSFGRENILKTRSVVEKEIETVILREGKAYLKEEVTSKDTDDVIVKLSVVYGDTDSVFVQCSSETNLELEDVELVGNRIAGIVSHSLPDPMELEFESIAERALFIAKKRYALWMFERSGTEWSESIKVKGMETVRRDWCELTSRTLNSVLELILKEGDVEKAMEYVRGVVDRVRNIDVANDPEIIDDLVLTRMYSKSMGSYKNKQPHLTVIEKMKKRTGAAPSIGERIPFVIVAGKDLFVNRAEDPDYVRQNNISLDVDYYIKKQILPPVSRILSAFGVDEAALDYDSKQKGLFEFSPSSEKKLSDQLQRRKKGTAEDHDSGNRKSQSSLFDF